MTAPTFASAHSPAKSGYRAAFRSASLLTLCSHLVTLSLAPLHAKQTEKRKKKE
jgi:hypothetical protein